MSVVGERTTRLCRIAGPYRGEVDVRAKRRWLWTGEKENKRGRQRFWHHEQRLSLISPRVRA